MGRRPNALVIHASDNVAVTLEDVKRGETVHLADGREIAAVEDIPYSHKIALRDLSPGEDILKYGEIIGQAKDAVLAVDPRLLGVENGGLTPSYQVDRKREPRPCSGDTQGLGRGLYVGFSSSCASFYWDYRKISSRLRRCSVRASITRPVRWT